MKYTIVLFALIAELYIVAFKLLHVVMCRFFGHKWKYNFPSIPNKAMCTRCKCKSVLNLKTLEWISVKNFDKEKRTDEQLVRDWV